MSLRMLGSLAAGDYDGAMDLWRTVKPFEELRARHDNANNVSVVKEALAQLELCATDACGRHWWSWMRPSDRRWPTSSPPGRPCAPSRPGRSSRRSDPVVMLGDGLDGKAAEVTGGNVGHRPGDRAAAQQGGVDVVLVGRDPGSWPGGCGAVR
jgi:hypothetical protein